MTTWLFSTTWPKGVTGSGYKTLGMLYTFIGEQIYPYFFSPQPKNSPSVEELKEFIQVRRFSMDPTDENKIAKQFNSTKVSPDFVIFDSVSSEQIFFPAVNKHFPNCLRILNIDELYGLNTARQEAFEKHKQLNCDVLNSYSNQENEAKMITSLNRSDLVFFSSDYDQMKAIQKYRLENSALITFFYKDREIDAPLRHNFGRRNHFIWKGDCQDPAFLDSLNWTINEIWPKISKELPKAELHLLCQNITDEIREKEGPNIKIIEKLEEPRDMEQYKIMLLPLRFGAGIKKDICDGWLHGVPAVTTPIGAEGMFKQTFDNNIEYRKLDMNARFYSDELDMTGVATENPEMMFYYNYTPQSFILNNSLSFGGKANNFDSDAIAKSAVELYTNRDLWYECQSNGKQILAERMSFQRNYKLFMKHISLSQANLTSLRKKQVKSVKVETEKVDKLSKYLSGTPKEKMKTKNK